MKSTDNLLPNPRPALDYSAAARRIEELQARDTDEINPLCRTKFMTHGRKVERSAVFLHGLTNCPQGFEKLGTAFYDLGWNVLIPRVPHHGLADRMTSNLAKLTAETLVTFTDEVVDIGRGLGRHVTLAGISMAGCMTAWAAQQRADLDLAVIIAPTFGLHAAPTALTQLTTALFSRLPNFFIWWDPRCKADLPGPKYAYPRFSTHALSQAYRLGFAVQACARQAKPAARSILAVTNANDLAVNNTDMSRLVSAWRKRGATNVRTYEFAADLMLPHDWISPEQPGQRVEVTYPIFIDLITSALG
ncbi:MAG: alpha/beta hydrolase [Chloroflexi bacterium]|nr:alpha/beta hydrolase [Chloroflexota bacterium]